METAKLNSVDAQAWLHTVALAPAFLHGSGWSLASRFPT
jgi:hypothetical protein